MGFLTNADQEKQLSSDEFQNAVVQGLVEAFSRVRDARGAVGRSGGPAQGPGR